MYARSCYLVVFSWLLLGSLAPLAAADRWPCIHVGDGEAEQRIHSTLDAKTDLDFTDSPLSEVLAYLSELHNIPIILDTRALEEMGLSGDRPITVNLSQVSFRSALKIMLTENGLDYVIRDEVLQVTTPQMASTTTPVCLFDVSQLAPNAGDMDTLLATVQSHANRYSAQVSIFRNVLIVKGNHQQQDEIGAFLAALFQAQAQTNGVAQ